MADTPCPNKDPHPRHGWSFTGRAGHQKFCPGVGNAHVEVRVSKLAASAESTRVCVKVTNEAFSELANCLLGELTEDQEKRLRQAVDSLKDAADQAEGMAYRMADWAREHQPSRRLQQPAPVPLKRYVIDTELTPEQMETASLVHDRDMVAHFELVANPDAPSE